MAFELVNPEGLEKPSGYSHVARITSGKLILVAGQGPLDADGAVVGCEDFVVQFRQVIANLKRAIEGAGGKPEDYAALTVYVRDLQAYVANREAIGLAYRAVFGKHFPAITLVEVRSLYQRDCMIEISGIAVID